MNGMNNNSVWTPEEYLKRFSYILDNIDDAFFHLDTDFRFTYVNQAATQLAEMQAEQMLGQVVWDVWPHLKTYSTVVVNYHEAIETGKAQHFQFKGLKSSRYYEASLYPSPDGIAVLISDKTEKINAEQQLRETQDRYYQALEAAQMVAWEWDVQENRLEFSGNFADFFGAQDLQRGEEILRLVHRDDLHDHLRMIKRAMREGGNYASSFRIRRPDNGEIAWLEEWGMGVVGDDGKVRKLIGVVKNITERKRVEDALRTSEERFRLASRAVEGVLYDWSIDREEVYQSEGLERLIGYRTNEEPGSRKDWWPQNIHPDDYPPVRAELHAAIESRTDSFSYEYRIRHKDGHWVHVLDQGYIVRDEEGHARRVVGICTDISERVRSERALQESEARFRTSVESLLDGFAILSAVRDPATGQIVDFLYEYINEAGCRMNHRTYEEQVGQSLTKLLPNQRENGLFERYVNVVETGQPVEVEDEQYEDVFGSERRLRRAFEVRAVKMGDGIALVWRNVSQRKQAEQQIRTYAEKLERSNRELEQFAFVASHDLQEPLRKIRLFGDSLRSNFGQHLSEEAGDALERMQRAAQRMQAMIDGLLELSRVNTRGGKLEMTQLHRVMEEVVSDLEARIQASGGRVVYGDLPAAQVDVMQMRQLFQNLIGNALKFQQPGSSPVVFISSQAALLGNIPAVTICVRDNGIGFDMQHADRIFQPFQRLIGRSQYEGTGMGLAICHKIVERHRGKIEVISKPGEGTTFLITLPLHQEN